MHNDPYQSIVRSLISGLSGNGPERFQRAADALAEIHKQYAQYGVWGIAQELKLQLFDTMDIETENVFTERLILLAAAPEVGTGLRLWLLNGAAAFRRIVDSAVQERILHKLDGLVNASNSRVAKAAISCYSLMPLASLVKRTSSLLKRIEFRAETLDCFGRLFSEDSATEAVDLGVEPVEIFNVLIDFYESIAQEEEEDSIYWTAKGEGLQILQAVGYSDPTALARLDRLATCAKDPEISAAAKDTLAYLRSYVKRGGAATSRSSLSFMHLCDTFSATLSVKTDVGHLVTFSPGDLRFTMCMKPSTDSSAVLEYQLEVADVCGKLWSIKFFVSTEIIFAALRNLAQSEGTSPSRLCYLWDDSPHEWREAFQSNTLVAKVNCGSDSRDGFSLELGGDEFEFIEHYSEMYCDIAWQGEEKSLLILCQGLMGRDSDPSFSESAVPAFCFKIPQTELLPPLAIRNYRYSKYFLKAPEVADDTVEDEDSAVLVRNVRMNVTPLATKSELQRNVKVLELAQNTD